jgi:GT2 family glycosyltransferase/glycosyltransferase involved in cell wall biosynthesis
MVVAMHWFLKTFIIPLLDALQPAVIVEVGVELGAVTGPLLEWAAAHEAAQGAAAQSTVLHSIDPSPKLEVDELLAAHPERLRFHRAPSLAVLEQIADVDLALIDGDHNWYTVINELRQLEQRAVRDNRLPPVVLLHDIGWPYGRRDLYYDPQSIPTADRQPHARLGIVPGQSELTPLGANGHLENARTEGTPANGVLTAIEDFIAQSQRAWRWQSIPGLSGLGVLVDEALYEDATRKPLRELLERVDTPAFLRAQCEAIEGARVDSEVRRARTARRLGETELQLRAFDPEKLVELEERAVQLQEQLRLVDELETGLRGALQESASHALGATPGGEDTAPIGDQTASVSGGDADASPSGSTPGDEIALGYRLTLALAARERLQADLNETHATFAAQLDAAREEVHAARRAQELLRGELMELKVELQVADAQRARLQSALARTRADMEVADGEREAIERRLRELTAARTPAQATPTVSATAIASAAAATPVLADSALGAPQSGNSARRETETATAYEAARRERDELAHALAQLHARSGDVAAWERELEQRGRQAFLDAYLPLLDGVPRGDGERDPLSLPLPSDRMGLLCAAEEPQDGNAPSVDVVVCVHDAPADVRRCLCSLLQSGDRRFRLILVDDGSAAPAAALVADFAERHPTVTLIVREQPPHGYTLAANAGLRASGSDYVVLLNSDTIVTPGWLERIVECGERQPQVGILGPLSNAASHQSVPQLREGGAWAVNPLPDWLTVEGMAIAVARGAPRVDAQLPFINGFCYAVKRSVIESLGEFDEERFAEGYCEENDYSHRAYKRGWRLAVADDAYVYHAKSRSYGSEGRAELARRHYEAFMDKHDRTELQELVASMEADTTLQPVRHAVAQASADPQALAALLRADARGLDEREPLRVAFILPGLAEGGSGGSHSIYQEVKGMRELGIPAYIALHAKAWPRAQAVYEDAQEVFRTFEDVDELAEVCADADVISATHYKSVVLLGALRERRADFLAAYYVQDYEPFFSAPESDDLLEASASYTALPDAVLFAKTHWLCNVVGARHGVRVARVEPSIDERLFHAAAQPPGFEQQLASESAQHADGFERQLADEPERHERPVRRDGPVRVLAMIRPRTPRRQPITTVALLERLLAELPNGEVQVATFGCGRLELARLTRSHTILDAHLGVLSRAQVAEQLRGADVFLDMSMYQAFGRSALEAMACGATAVVPQLGGAWEFLQDGVNALAVDTLDLDAAFAALAALADDRERLAAMRTVAQQTGARYSIARAALSEYLLFEREHRRRFGERGARNGRPQRSQQPTSDRCDVRSLPAIPRAAWLPRAYR